MAPLTHSAVTTSFLSSVTPCSVLPVLWSWDAWIHGNFMTLEKSKSFNSAGNSQENSWSGCSSDPSPSTLWASNNSGITPFPEGSMHFSKFTPRVAVVWSFLGGFGASQVAQWVKNPAVTRRCKRLGFNPWVRKTPWRRAWQPTPVFLPGESHGQRRLAGDSPWGRKESDTTEHARRHTQ